MTFLELSLGQYVQAGIYKFWNCAPVARGLAISALVVSFVSFVGYPAVIAGPALIYAFGSLRGIAGTLPWSECQEGTNCVPLFEDNATVSVGSGCSDLSECTESSVIQYHASLMGEGSSDVDFDYARVLSSLATYILVCLFLFKGLKSIEKVQCAHP